LEENMKKTIITLTIIAALALSLAGCSSAPAAEPETPAAENEAAAPEAQVTADVPSPAEEDGQTAPSETPAVPGRQDGERFEAVIMLEGMEETVHYEHIRNEALGFEMDYDYELFTRHTEEDREWFVSVWDDPANPENYLELTRSSEDAETAAAAISEELSKDFDLIRVTRDLDGAGSCIRIEASVIKGTNRMADELQAVYIIPAPDGCRIATAHSFIAESEGFYRRFDYMLNTLSVIAK
jgi:hypothetical protein